MEYSVRSGDPAHLRTACVVIGVWERGRLSRAARTLDAASGGHLTELLRRGGLEGKPGQSWMLPALPGVQAERVLLVGCGRERGLNERTYRKIATHTATALEQAGIGEAVACLPELPIRGRDLRWRVGAATEAAGAALYRFTAFKSEPDTPRRPLRRITWRVPERGDVHRCRPALELGRATAAGVSLARDLANAPPNVCTPDYLAEEAERLAERHEAVTAYSLQRREMEELGMGGVLAVARGAENPPRLIVMEYHGTGGYEPPVVLVGKGVTFDSGGISLKPGEAMDEMKYDMCGAASVFGAVAACAEAGLPLRVVGVIPAVENMPDGRATRPGDIVTTMAGKRVEILNTDAEGRMILADALTYSERFNPAVTVDIATLTGACIIALGHHRHGLMGNHPALVRELLQAGRNADDPAWELPLGDEYDEQLKSPFGDFANIGGRSAGTITAGCFLQRFAGKMRWAHLDIAGTAWKSGEQKGATGRPVPLLTRFLAARARWDR